MDTLEGKLLLGWMAPGDAETALCQASHFEPALTRARAAEIWKKYETRVDALEERPLTITPTIALEPSESAIAAEFLAGAKKQGAKNVVDVVKVLPGDLLIHQFHLVTTVSQKYDAALADPTSWASCCLGSGMLSGKVQAQQQGSKIVAQLSHAEYRAAFTRLKGN